MNFPNYFADAESDFTNADFVIFGVPFGETSSFRFGADKAPKEIRLASWNFETFDIRTKTDLQNIKIHDYGDLKIDKNNISKTLDHITNFSRSIFKSDKFLIAIGGEHSITPGIIKAYPKDIGVLFLDAHLDFRQIYENNINNHACSLRRVSDHISIENIVHLGLRSAEKEEFYNAKKANLFYKDAFNIRKNGIKKAISDTKKYLDNKKIYLTFDIDVVDPAYAPGTSTPEPFGLSPFEILEIIDGFSDQIIGFDIVEVCPNYDHGQTSLLAAKFIRYIISKCKNYRI